MDFRLAKKLVAGKRANRQEQQFLKQEFEVVANDALLRPKTSLESCLNKIVRFNFEEGSSSAATGSNGRVGWFWGRIAKSDVLLRLLHVLFYDPHDIALFRQDIPYDHPDLQWFALPGDDDFVIETVVDLVNETTDNPVVTSEADLHNQLAVFLQRFVRGR